MSVNLSIQHGYFLKKKQVIIRDSKCPLGVWICLTADVETEGQKKRPSIKVPRIVYIDCLKC